MSPMTLLQRYHSLLGGLLAELQAAYGPRLVACAVFGSVGRGTARHDSDIDLLIVARGFPPRAVQPGRGIPRPGAAPRALGPDAPGHVAIALSPIFKSPEEVEAGSPLFLDLVDDARILYDPAGFLAGHLGRLRARLRELGARRIWQGNAWYWDLKPDLRPGEVFSL